MKTLIEFTLTATFLAGCATGYKPDLANRPAATVRIASLHAHEARAAVLTGECVPFARASWDQNTHAIGVLTAKGIEQKVPAGALLSLAFYTSSTSVSGAIATDAVCAVAMRFTPEAGAEYDAVFSGGADECQLDLSRRRSPADGGPRIEPVPDAKGVPGC